MVSKKSIYNGRFDGFQPPVVPKAPRSVRRSSYKKSSEGGSKLCAFDLLAAVADKLLQESESSTSSIPKDFVKHGESEVKVKHVRSEHFDQGSCVESESLPESTNLKRKLEPPSKESPLSDNDSGLEHVSDVKTCDFLKKIGNNVKLEQCESKNVNKQEGDFNLVNNSIDDIQMESVEKDSGGLTFIDHVESCVNTNKPYSSLHLPFDNVKMGNKTDDDENSFKCNIHKTRAFRSQSRGGGYRRIRKMLTSRYRKLAPKKDHELTNSTSGVTKPLYLNRKNIYRRERCETNDASKRRKLFHPKSYNKNDDDNASNKVKFSIKSFKVPEVYVEISETATIGSLKRTVMEAVTAILGGELHVGILLEGKKVKDNNRTLQQTGISQNCTLGVTLEPSFPIVEEPPSLVPSSAATSLDNGVDKIQDEEMTPLKTEVLTEEKEADSKALVPVKTEALSVVPANHQPTKKSDVSQRRIRRPFSVSEVEALVEAVETLGTGRWRDVKLRAFDEANHRTYVDLKDKWKTLVHTASISPQQRRGEPVPQDLLDRVLAAHGYWSNHQFKQQRKHQNEPLRILNGSSVEFAAI